MLHIFILSTVYRCSAFGQGRWHSHLAYFGGFSASVLLSIALYVALTLMDPGYIPVVKGHKIQVHTLPHCSISGSGSLCMKHRVFDGASTEACMPVADHHKVRSILYDAKQHYFAGTCFVASLSSQMTYISLST